MKLTPEILAMYLGCNLFFESRVGNPKAKESKLLGVSIDRAGTHLTLLPKGHASSNTIWYSTSDFYNFKPILRRLVSMTEEEMKQVWVLEYDCPFDPMESELDDITWNFDSESWSVKAFQWLLSKGFDLFGLIDAGLAIENEK